jgi:hypothetical protein
VHFLFLGTKRLDFSQLLAVSESPGRCDVLNTLILEESSKPKRAATSEVCLPLVETYFGWQSSKAKDPSLRSCVFYELEAEVMPMADGNTTLASSRKLRAYAFKRKRD